MKLYLIFAGLIFSAPAWACRNTYEAARNAGSDPAVLELDREVIPIGFSEEHKDFTAVEITRFLEGDYIVEVAAPVYLKGHAQGGPSPEAGRESYLKYALDKVEFAIQMSGRREWPAAFDEMRRKIAEDYLDQSIYYTVYKRQPNTNLRGKMVATYREIVAPYSYSYRQNQRNVQVTEGSQGIIQQSLFSAPWRTAKAGAGAFLSLAMEKIFGVRFKRPIIKETYNSDLDTNRPLSEWMNDIGFLGNSRFHSHEGEGLVIEPGNFAIDKSYNKDVAGKILVHLLSGPRRLLGRAGIDPANVTYYTYGNRASKIQYGRLGFEPLAGYELRFQEGPEEARQYVWIPLQAKYEDLENTLKHLRERRAGVSQEELDALLELYERLDEIYMGRLN